LLAEMFDFMLAFTGTASELSQLLGARFVPGSKPQEGAIGQALTRVLALHNAGRHFERDLEVARLALLARQLCEIEKARPDVLASLKRRRRSGAVDDFHGARQEVTVAKALIRAGISFDHELDGRPDFVCKAQRAKPGLSARASTLQQPKDRHLFYKVQSAMRRKAEKRYAATSVALTIATTSIERIEDIDRLELAGALAGTPSDQCLRSPRW
jgi:hypothetical protein